VGWSHATTANYWSAFLKAAEAVAVSPVAFMSEAERSQYDLIASFSKNVRAEVRAFCRGLGFESHHPCCYTSLSEAVTPSTKPSPPLCGDMVPFTRKSRRAGHYEPRRRTPEETAQMAWCIWERPSSGQPIGIASQDESVITR
jgi:hypothetical protein